MERREWIHKFENTPLGREALTLLQKLRTPGREKEFDRTLLPMTLTACYEAKIFSESIDPNQSRRQLDAIFLDTKEISQQITAAKRIRKFIIDNWNSPTYQISRPHFFFKMRDEYNLVMTNNEDKKPLSALNGLDLALQAYIDTLKEISSSPIKLCHHQIYGCLMYKKCPNSDNPDPTTMLAFNLQLYFRYYSLKKFGVVCQGAGLSMPQGGRAHHNIVASLVSATFVMKRPWNDNNAQKNVANLTEQYPDIVFDGWPNP